MDKTTCELIEMAIQSVTGPPPVGLHEPSFSGNELLYTKNCIDSTFVSSVGKYVDQFELEIARYTGSKYAVAMVNGTAALHIGLKLAGVQPGDEVLIPALTFVATANAVAYCGAYPHFFESDESSLGLDALKLRTYLLEISEQRSGHCVNIKTGRVIRTLVPMHTFGHPGDIDGVLGIARDFNLTVVEDAAESLGSFFKGQHTGTFGLMGVLSFNGNKIITTGGGGALLTNNMGIARYAKHLTTTAKVSHSWEFLHDEIGYNYRMPNINAALGCAQLEQLPQKISLKRELFIKYQNAFKLVPGVRLMKEPENCQSNYWLQALILDRNLEDLRDNILKSTNQSGIMTRPAWMLLADLKPYKNCPSMDLSIARSLSKRLINIPSSIKGV